MFPSSHLTYQPNILTFVFLGPPPYGDVSRMGGRHILKHQLLQLRLRPPDPRLVNPTFKRQLNYLRTGIFHAH